MADANIKNLVFGMLLLVILIFGGAYLFSFIEGVNLFDSLYSIFLVVTTVESPENPLTFNGRVLIMVVLAFGMGLMFYIAISIASAVIEGNTTLLLGGIKGGLVRMKKEKNHTIVCGYGKLGKYVCSILKEKKQKYIVIDKDSDKCTNLVSSGESVLQGDALDPRVLKKAGVEKARGLIGTLGEDSENIYLIMTATDLNPNLDLAAKAEEEHAVERLHKVGAKIVVLPQVVGGKQLANAFLELEKSEDLETIIKKK